MKINLVTKMNKAVYVGGFVGKDIMGNLKFLSYSAVSEFGKIVASGHGTMINSIAKEIRELTKQGYKFICSNSNFIRRNGGKELADLLPE
jgi:hypothetical protein